MNVGFPVIFQLPVQVCDGSFHLFEKVEILPVPPAPGMLLTGFNMPNVVGIEAGFDNTIRRVILDGHRRTTLAQLMGFREPAMNLAEVTSTLEGWTYVRCLHNVVDEGPQDPMQQGNQG